MAITVRQLVDIPDLRTWVHAGEGGVGREITWAHAIELPDPTEWLGPDELLMTTGIGVPEEPAAQKAYVERLADAGLSGLAIGHDMPTTPEVSPAMVSAAEERSLPLLFTSYDVPFTAVVRAVADANRDEERARLAQTQRIYETVRQAASDVLGPELLARLGDIVGCDLYALDPERGLALLDSDTGVSQEVVRTVTEEKKKRAEPMPAVLRLGTRSCPVMAVAVPVSRPATLVALPKKERKPDLSILRHVSAVVALELEKETSERERRRRLGQELLAGLIDGRIPTESAAQMLSERGLAEEPRVLATCATDGVEAERSDLHLRLEDRGVPHVLLRRAPLLTALLPDTPEALAGFRDEIDSAYAVGLSAPLGRVGRVPDAKREARWALESAEINGEPFVRYGDERTSWLLPRSLSEAERIVQEVLGPVLNYDSVHKGQLIESLEAFLVHNRSWKKTADALHLHKQTLAYRIRRVEELTGRRLDHTENVAELWIALRAARASGLLKNLP